MRVCEGKKEDVVFGLEYLDVTSSLLGPDPNRIIPLFTHNKNWTGLMVL
jgi:hypothetical protein